MSTVGVARKDEKRCERKFVVSSHEPFSVEMLIKTHPVAFREIYPPRHVNNLYLDSHDLRNYSDNVNGVANRRKVRVRWYGEPAGVVRNAKLEFKLKRGVAGWKRTCAMHPFRFAEGDEVPCVFDELLGAAPSEAVAEVFRGSALTLFNSYNRQYFLSFDGKYRLTLDTELRYCPLRVHRSIGPWKYRTLGSCVVEFKYDVSDDVDADRISSLFPFLISRNSKYVNGVELGF